MSDIMATIERLVAVALRRHTERDHNDWRTGRIVTVDTTNKRCTVTLQGASTATGSIPYLTTYTPAVNDYVIVLGSTRGYVVIGPVNAV